MIVCSCNVLSDKQILSAITAVQHRARTLSQVYARLGCRARCGQCAPTIKKIRDEASGYSGYSGCAASCQVGKLRGQMEHRHV